MKIRCQTCNKTCNKLPEYTNAYHCKKCDEYYNQLNQQLTNPKYWVNDIPDTVPW